MPKYRIVLRVPEIEIVTLHDCSPASALGNLTLGEDDQILNREAHRIGLEVISAMEDRANYHAEEISEEG